MTPEEVETELRDRGIGWHPVTRVAIREDVPTLACNTTHCATLADVGTWSEASVSELCDAVVAEVDGDPSDIRDLGQLAKLART
jgi:hypothetical protein